MSLFRKTPPPNAICPYCHGLTTLLPNTEEVCGFCESELMRGLNFYVPLDAYLQQHSLEEFEQWLIRAKEYLATTKTKTARFYAKDNIAGIRKLIKLKRQQIQR